jgi:hypothetical protein
MPYASFAHTKLAFQAGESLRQRFLQFVNFARIDVVRAPPTLGRKGIVRRFLRMHDEQLSSEAFG